MTCTQCGNTLTPEDQFCAVCGTPRPRLAPAFEKVAQQHKALKARYDAGQLSDPDFDAELRKLVIRDSAGTSWMIGARTGQWYRHEGQQWVLADPLLGQAAAAPKAVPPPAKGRSCLGMVIAALAIVGLLLIAGIVLGIVFREPLGSAAGRLAREQGWLAAETATPAPQPALAPTSTSTPIPQPAAAQAPTATVAPPAPAAPTTVPATAPATATARPTTAPTVAPPAPPPPAPAGAPPVAPANATAPISVTPTNTAPATNTVAPIPTVAPSNTPAATNTPIPVLPSRPTSGSIAFTEYYSTKPRDPGKYDIYIANVDGSNKRKLIERASEPVFSPDGRRLAFYSWDEGGVFVINPDGSGRMRVSPHGNDAWPAWSPDQGTIAYSVMRGTCNIYDFIFGTCNPRFDIYSIPIGGKGETNIIDGEQPSWGPDGRLVYKGCLGSNCGLMIVVPGDRNGKQRITTNANDSNPVWSHVNNKIVFSSDRSGNWDIWITNPDGSGVRQLTTATGNDGTPTWAVDGQWIYFRSDRDGEWAIWAMRPDGSGQVKLFPSRVSDRWWWERISAGS